MVARYRAAHRRVEDPGGPTIRALLQIRTVIALVVLALAGMLSTTIHTVRPGETLGGIAARHGTTVAALAATNGISDPDRIRAGQELRISSAAGGGSSSGGERTHTVRPGETLGGIAARHGTTVAALVAANGISDPNRVAAGRTLRIPDRSGAPAPGSGSGGAAFHVVARGETIAGIARRYGISTDQLIEANGLVDGRIYAHQRLYLTSPGRLPEIPSGVEHHHVVAAGETLSRIAARYGAAVSAIVAANGIADPNLVRAGAQLRIPGGGAGLVCPVAGARFVNDWGFPRSGGRFHLGNDLFAPRGTPVRAPVAGTVTQSTGQVAGLQVSLLAPDGTRWIGTHLDRFGASGPVRAGDVIGYVGDTGNARGGPTHLHLEVHPSGGGPVNPFPLVVAACR